MNPSKTKLIDVQQNTPEWFEHRIGKITASNFGKVMANYGKAFGDPAKRYAERLAVEQMTGERIEEYSNQYMERGHELEPFARECYAQETFDQVEECGIFINGNLGCSLDGLVAPDGFVEIKSVVYSTQFQRLRKGGYDTQYQWQIQGGLWLTGLDWCDFISYCPEMPESKQLYVFRVHPDNEMFKKLEIRMNEFQLLINENLELLK